MYLSILSKCIAFALTIAEPTQPITHTRETDVHKARVAAFLDQIAYWSSGGASIAQNQKRGSVSSSSSAAASPEAAGAPLSEIDPVAFWTCAKLPHTNQFKMEAAYKRTLVCVRVCPCVVCCM